MLPNLPYAPQKVRRLTTAWLGLNRTENTRAGELAASCGITTEHYPVLTQRRRRKAIEGFTAPCELAEWDGKLLVVDGGVLYYGGDALTGVMDGKKQFAVVNTKLIVWPDKLQIDLTDKTVEAMDAAVSNAGAAAVTGASIELSTTPKSCATTKQSYANRSKNYRSHPWVYTYERAEWSAESRQWTLTGGAWTDMFGGITGRIVIPEVGESETLGKKVVRLGNISTEWSSSAPSKPAPQEIGNTEGFYGAFRFLEGYQSTAGSEYKYEVELYDDTRKNEMGAVGVFRAGDAVTISGTLAGINDREKIILTEVDDATNTLRFAEDTFAEDGAWYATLVNASGKGESLTFKMGKAGAWWYREVGLEEELPEGAVVWLPADGNKAHFLIDGKEAWAQETKSSSGTLQNITLNRYSNEETAFTVARAIPELDFICERDNRLWGVSNKDKTIYASALGEPMRFFEFNGLSTDSYAVAVGSEGDFTGICSFGGGVCCFKENRLHKMLGSVPRDFYMTDYRIAGVQAGSSRSMTVINETLYYKGVAGVYAFAGGTPRLISYKLGLERAEESIGGTDGNRYFLSQKRASGERELLVYDIMNGEWICEGAIAAEAFTVADGELHMLVRVGERTEILKTDDEADEVIAWSAEFVPFVETDFVKQGTTKLLLRLDMSEGSFVQTEIREDCGQWRAVWEQQASEARTVNIPLRIGRCDAFSLRISGRGEVKIRTLAREFSAGSEV